MLKKLMLLLSLGAFVAVIAAGCGETTEEENGEETPPAENGDDTE